MRILLVLLCLFAGGNVLAADLKLLTAGAYKPAALELLAEFEKKTGHKVSVETGTAGALQKRVADGEYFDVVVIPPLAMGPLLGSRLDESSAKPLARAGIGIAVKQGTPLPDLSGVDSFKKALLDARAVAYVDPAAGGSSGIYLSRLFEKMGIADQIKGKAVLVPGGLVAERLVDGKADLALQQSSELMSVPGVQFAGPIPLDVQNYTLYSGAISVASGNRAAADALMLALADPGNVPLLKKKGLDGP